MPMGNQYDDNLTLLQWKTVKGAAIYYGVSDWVSKVDTTLSLDENIRLMEIHGTDMTSAGGRTVKELAVKEKAKTRWTK